MDTSSTTKPAFPRTKIPAEEFNLICGAHSMESDGQGLIGVRQKRKTWKDYLVIKESIYGGLDIEFINIEVIGEIHIASNKTLLPRLVLNNCKISNWHIENAQIHSISIIEGSIVESIRIRVNSQIGYLKVANSTIGKLKLENSIATILAIEKSSRIAKLHIWHSSLQRIKIWSGSFISHIRCQFKPQVPTHLLIGQSVIGFLDFEDSVSPEFTTLNLSNSLVNKISLSNFCNYGSIFFSGLKPLKNWEDFKKNEMQNALYVEGIPQFETVSHPSGLRLTDSDLGKMQFINCDLREFNRFEFSNTKMLDVFVAGSQMPGDKSFFLPNEEKNPIKIAEQKRLAYGQFKKIYEARGDVAGSLPYLAYEMEAYRQQLQMEGWWKNRGELAMLWANKLSTNYGVSWQRGLGVTLLTVIFFYFIFCYLIGYRFENNSPDDVARFWKVVSYAPYYLNPLRDLDSVFLLPDKDFTPAARIWDFVSRIFVAYFVYQTIQAFRKLGKSSG